jgi:hypothetical protein
VEEAESGLRLAAREVLSLTRRHASCAERAATSDTGRRSHRRWTHPCGELALLDSGRLAESTSSVPLLRRCILSSTLDLAASALAHADDRHRSSGVDALVDSN